MVNTGKLTYIMRRLGLMHLFDKTYFKVSAYRNRVSNRQFRKDHPGVVLPPDYMMFESYRLDYNRYYYNGKNDAEEIRDILSKYIVLKNINFLDWGCGPARIIRHMPGVIDNGCRFFGSDYNAKTIEWCSKNISGVTFSKNGIEPPLNYTAGFFDVAISLSIFTHLSEANHYKWIEEIARVIKRGGVFLMTTHGDACMVKLTDAEKHLYAENKLIARGNVVEGHRVYLAYHPPGFIRKMVSDYFDILEHYEGKVADWGIEQDRWVLRRK